MKRTLRAVFTGLAAIWAACALAAEDAAMVVVTPQQTDEILANPHMGWQTFHCTSREDRNLPSWIPSTVQYARWGWGRLEPQPGRIDYAFLDDILDKTRQSGQKLAFRVMLCSTTKGRPYHPAWLREVGAREIIADYQGVQPLPIPDLDDPAVLDRHLDFIRRLAERYDGHADIDHIDLGSVGWWGEWHLSGSKTAKMPRAETLAKIVDAYLNAFRKTPVLMLIGGGEHLKQAVQRGAGWRADCLGDMGGFSKTWCHMRKGYPIWIKQAGIENAWQNAPVAWETCWDMRKWVSEGWSLRFIFNYALACHGSYVNNKSAPLPPGDDVRRELERFLRRLGYRLVLREMAHAGSVRAGGTLALNMKWQNVGSAPCYRPYRLAYRLTTTTADGSARTFILPGQITVNRWMPGSVPLFTDEFFREPPDLPEGEVATVTDRITLPADMPAGAYTLAVSVVDKPQGPPVVRLAIAGRDADGWYPLSRVVISR